MFMCRPSASYIWSNCALYPSLIERLPKQPDSDPAREGTCAAWVAEKVINREVPDAFAMEGQTHPNGWLVTREMVQHVQKYVDIVTGDGHSAPRAEIRVSLSPYIQGTLDSTSALSSSCIRVADLKYGFVIVEVDENPQVMIYAGGLLTELGWPAHITHVELAIYQPRAHHHKGPWRTVTITVQELYAHLCRLIAAAEECNKPNPKATPGPHCTYCDAKTGCEANAHSAYAMFNYVESQHHRHMTSVELAEEFRTLSEIKKFIDSRYKSVEAEVEQRMQREWMPGLESQQRFGNRKFVEGVDALTIHVKTGVNPVSQTFKTPAEMEREGANQEELAKLTYTPAIGRKVKPMKRDFFGKLFNDG